jgi:hypothetical protein
MDAYHIDRFSSVDGIVLRATDDPRSGPTEILMRVRASALNYRDLMVLRGGGRPDKARRHPSERRRRRSCAGRREGDAGEGRRPDHRHLSSALVRRPD